MRGMHWLVLGVSLALTFFAWHYSKSQHDARIQALFDREADQIVELVKERMQKYEDSLWSGVAMLDAADHEIGMQQWQRYVKSLNLDSKYPGVNGLGIIHSVPTASLPEYLAKRKAETPQFQIHPAQNQETLLPISFIVPVKPNSKAIGLNMAHEPNRFRAALKAKESGAAQVTGMIHLVQNSEKTPGFLFYAPFYRDQQQATLEQRNANFAGMVYAPFIVKELLEGVLRKENRSVGLRLTDGTTILHDEHVASEADYDPTPLFTKSRLIEMYGRSWEFDIWSAKSFRKSANDSQPHAILIAGILINLLLLVVFVTLSQASKMAHSYAEGMTRKLEINNQQLQKEIQERKATDARLREINTSLEESRTTLQGLFDQSFNFISLMALDGTLLQINRTALELVGVNEKDVLYQPCWDTIWWSHSPDLQKRLRDAIRSAAAGEADRFEAVHPVANLADQQTVQVDVAVSPITNSAGDVIFIVMESRDISRLKEQEAETEKLLSDLGQSNSELEQFAYVASHDLQEPLRKISSYASLLEEECGDEVNEDGQAYIHVIVDGASRMKHLIQDLLAFSRIGRRGDTMEPVDTTQCLQDAIESLEISIAESEATITFDRLPAVLADQSQLIMLFQNLVGNALKYRTETPPVIEIEASDLGQEIEIAIKDNGIGIAPRYQERIFEIFQRLHNRREYSGTGIGLAVCKRIVERFEGTIRVEPNAPQGSTFLITLPKPSPTGRKHAIALLPSQEPTTNGFPAASEPHHPVG